MRESSQMQVEVSQNRLWRNSLPLRAQTSLMVLAAILFAARMLPAQAPSQPLSPTQAHKPAHPRPRPSAAHPLAAPAPAVTAPAKPSPPQPPHWPANDNPSEASVVWDSQGLRIDAANSSLQQILKEVSTATGAKIEGMSTDERVFGVYGPGQARDVLSQLLQGSGYNVLMIGDQGQGAPRQVVLTSRHAGDTPPGATGNPPAANDDDADADEQPQSPAPAPIRPAFTPGGPPRTPQQIVQEMQRRQQQMQQHQQPAPTPITPQN
jgi:hypothetical protein